MALNRPRARGRQDAVAQRHFLLEALAQPVGGTCVIGGFAGAVEIAKRAKFVSRVPGIESQPLDHARIGHASRRDRHPA